jgi:hypothetical protein
VKTHFTRDDASLRNTRYDWDCNFCSAKVKNARVQELKDHLTMRCKQCPEEVREEILDVLAGSVPPTTAPSVASSNPASVVGKRKQSSLAQGFNAQRPFPPDTQELHAHLLLRWLIMCGVAFQTVSNVFFIAWVKAISGGRSKTPGEIFFKAAAP